MKPNYLYQIVCFLTVVCTPVHASVTNSLLGNWSCEQRNNITENLTGINKYTVGYSANAIAIQNGEVIFNDKNSKKQSKIDYQVEFEYRLEKEIFFAVAKSVTFEIRHDHLNIIPKPPSSLFPAVGDEVEGRYKIIDDKLINEFSDGLVIECNKYRL